MNTRLIAPLLAALSLPAPPLAAQEDHADHGEHAGHALPAPAADPHAGHGAAPPDPHAGHGSHAGDGVRPPADPTHHAHHPVAPPPGPRLPVPTAEEIRAAFPDLGPHAHMAAPSYAFLQLDRLEAVDADDGTALAWDGRASWGGSLDRVVASSEGERLHGATGAARHELYWRHAATRWWETRLGLRHDEGEGPSRGWVGAGVEGLAPFFVEVSAVAYAGEDGRTALNLEAELDLRLTNRLILQPRLELDAYGKADPANGLGRGLAGAEAGLRLRYELRREVAPYLGVEWTRRLGDSADLARAAGERRGEASAVAGVRLWY